MEGHIRNTLYIRISIYIVDSDHLGERPCPPDLLLSIAVLDVFCGFLGNGILSRYPSSNTGFFKYTLIGRRALLKLCSSAPFSHWAPYYWRCLPTSEYLSGIFGLIPNLFLRCGYEAQAVLR